MLPSPSEIAGTGFLDTFKGGAGADAEFLLERVREKHFPDHPSRLRCHFLNRHRDVAEYRMRGILRGNKLLVRCYIVADGANVHFADAAVYERLEGRPEDESFAIKYWNTFVPKTEDERMRLEVVTDCKLFFPDWQTFPRINVKDLAPWGENYSRGAR